MPPYLNAIGLDSNEAVGFVSFRVVFCGIEEIWDEKEKRLTFVR